MQFGQFIHILNSLYAVVIEGQILQLCQFIKAFNYLNVVEWEICEKTVRGYFLSLFASTETACVLSTILFMHSTLHNSNILAMLLEFLTYTVIMNTGNTEHHIHNDHSFSIWNYIYQ